MSGNDHRFYASLPHPGEDWHSEISALFNFAPLKFAITLALVDLVLSETVASNAGIGFLTISATLKFDVALVFAGLVVVAIMGVLIYGVFAKPERRSTGWATRKLDLPSPKADRPAAETD